MFSLNASFTLLSAVHKPNSALCELPREIEFDKADASLYAGDATQVSGWMSQWKTRGYQGNLVISRFADPIYFLYSPISWVPDRDLTGGAMSSFTIPKGFVTDFASIPRVFWSALRPDGNYAYSAVLHDYLYWEQKRPREVADAILRRSMLNFRVSKATVDIIYSAVRLGGQGAWNANRDLRRRGESRFLRRFPDDPTISWNDWKKDKENFFQQSAIKD